VRRRGPAPCRRPQHRFPRRRRRRPPGASARSAHRPAPNAPSAPQALGPLDVAVNTAAISQPAQCERDYARAAAINVPTKLVEALERQRDGGGGEALLVHLSTDQARAG
jgi:hypothetical protein